MKKLFVYLALILGLVSCQPKVYEISRGNIERVLQYLSSDELGGRATYTPYIDSAANYIANEFEAIGLSTQEGNNGYFQEFYSYEIVNNSKSAKVNDENLAENRIIVASSSSRLDWSLEDVEIHQITSEDKFRESFTKYYQEEGNHLIMVDSTHLDMFSTYSTYFGNPTKTSDTLSTENAVFLLGNWDDVKSLELKVRSRIGTHTLRNIVGVIPGKRSEEWVLFTAHYDHVGIQPGMDEDSVFNGANDNASGTTGVIELARYYASKGQPERTLLFVAFTAEENGLVGSNYFGENLDADKAVAMINMEMIGKPAVEGPNTAWITGFDRSDLGKILQESAEGSMYQFYADPYPEQNLFYRSDNASLAKLGVPAHTISTTPIDVDKDYHQASDEIETLDMEHLTNTIKAIATGAEMIVSGEKTPSRIVPD